MRCETSFHSKGVSVSRPDRELAVALGARIRELRLDAEMTQDELAHRVDSKREIISRIEHGHHLPTWRTLAEIAIGLDIDLATLLIPLDWDRIDRMFRETLRTGR